MVSRLKALREKLNLEFEIFGVGGVMTPQDFQAYRKAGADCVQSATGTMWNPHLAQEVKEEL
jgi:dihydroorotate dehydrogenase